MSAVSLHVIGLGVGAGMRLSAPAESTLARAHTVIGSARQLELVEAVIACPPAQAIELPKLAELKNLLDGLPAGDVVVLASGDPLYYGIGRWLLQQFGRESIQFYPAVSSIQALCNRVGLALQDCRVISLHGRDVSGINRVLKQNSNLVVLTDRHSHPRALAQACIDAGFEQSRLHLGEDMGAVNESYREFSVTDLVADPTFVCSDLHVSLIQTRGRGGVLPEFPGIDDYSFVTDGAPGQGMFTKREVRLAILALMQPGNGDVIWDLGAGCGGVATELSHWNEQLSVYAVEQHERRLQCLAANRIRFGCAANLHIIEGRASQAVADLPVANKVFIGGSDGELEAMIEVAWRQLPVNGLLLASSVTAASTAQLQAFALELQPDQVQILRIAVDRGECSEAEVSYHSKLPVTLFRFQKSGTDS